MKLENLPFEFQKALPLIQQLEKAGYEAYFVGGCVRDTLLGKAIHDVDIATSASPHEMKQLFPKTVDIGIEHGTLLVLFEKEKYEITTFRTETDYQDFRRPDTVNFVRSLEEDLKRRDFTMNALAMNRFGEIVDLFDGMLDLKNEKIRAVGRPSERFHEDALRMMRGIRFASQLGFQIESETEKAIQKDHALLANISVERVYIEFTKLLLGKFRKIGLTVLVESECYLYCPMLRNEGQNLLKLAELPAISFANEVGAWTMLCFILNKKARDLPSFLKGWKMSNQLIKNVISCFKGLNARLTKQWDSETLYEIGLSNSLEAEKLLLFLNVSSNIAEVKKLYQELPIYQITDLAVNGTELLNYCQQPAGPWLGELLKRLEKEVLTRALPNEKEILLQFAKVFCEEKITDY